MKYAKRTKLHATDTISRVWMLPRIKYEILSKIRHEY